MQALQSFAVRALIGCLCLCGLAAGKARAQSDMELEQELKVDPIMAESPDAKDTDFKSSADAAQPAPPASTGANDAKLGTAAPDAPSLDGTASDGLSLDDSAPNGEKADNATAKGEAGNKSGAGNVVAGASADEPAAASASLFDAPNRKLEERLHQIYQRHSAPIPEEKWDEMISGQRAESYRIRKGNTLSGISASLFGDKQYWPKIWSENGGVENPHLIIPGKTVRFVPGNEENAPSITLADPDRLASEVDLLAPSYDTEVIAAASPDDATAGSVLDEMELEKPVVPAPDRPPAKVAGTLPPSFISMDQEELGHYDRNGLEVVRKKAITVPGNMIPSHYWADEKPRGIGRVAEIEASIEVASTLQNVLVTLDRPGKIGERFSVVSQAGSADRSFLSGGVVLQVGGVIEIVGVASRADSLYRAMVLKAVGPIKKNAIVMEEKLPRIDFTRNGNLKKLQTVVVGGEFENDRRVLGTGSVIYLGAGTASGLAPGDLLSVRSRRGARREDTSFPDVSRPIAIAKIVHAQTNGATAFVIEASEEVVPGDMTGGNLPQIGRQSFILDRARIVDIDYELARERERGERESGWQKSAN